MQDNIYVTTLAAELRAKLHTDLQEKGFTFTAPPYTLFCAKAEGVSCTLYTSGKLVIQGKQLRDFVEFYLEPEILGTFSFTAAAPHPLDAKALAEHIGCDEAGKGDLFGPLCVAALHANESQIKELLALKVADSKTMKDAAVLKIAPKVRSLCAHQLVILMPERYNELYASFGNLNHMLAWAHATALAQLSEQSGCSKALLDKFAHESLMQRALAKKGSKVQLEQRTHAEEDPVVAGASILAREAFLLGLARLSERFGVELPRGAAQKTVTAGRRFVANHGSEQLKCVAKIHFKTASECLR